MDRDTLRRNSGKSKQYFRTILQVSGRLKRVAYSGLPGRGVMGHQGHGEA